jgi:hypothetical protein
MVKELETLMVKHVKLPHSSHDVFFDDIPTTSKKESNETIWARCLLPKDFHHNSSDFIHTERQIKMTEILWLPIQII